MKKRFLATAAIIIVLVLVTKQFFFKSTSSAETATVTNANLEEKLTISGKIAANQDAVLTFQTGGLLTWVGVKVGDSVKKYQAIASLDQRQIQKNIQKYLNTYEKTRDTFENTQTTYKDQTLWTDSIRRILHDSQMDLNNSVIDVEVQDLARQLSVLTSPIDGVVVRADAQYPGINVTPLVTRYEIVNPQSVYFSISADQTEVTKVKVGDQAQLTLDPYPDQPIGGKVTSISFVPEAGETGTVYEAKLQLATDNSDYHFRVGMTGDATFVTSRAENTLAVPSRFVKNDGTKNYVNVLVGSKPEKTFVETGIETDELTEIKSGLSQGQTVTL